MTMNLTEEEKNECATLVKIKDEAIENAKVIKEKIEILETESIAA